MAEENPHVSEADLKEHFGDSGYHLVNELNASLPDEEEVQISEVAEPFTDDFTPEHQSSTDEYLAKVEERFYKQPKAIPGKIVHTVKSKGPFL